MVDESEEGQKINSSTIISTLAIQDKARYKTFVNIGND